MARRRDDEEVAARNPLIVFPHKPAETVLGAPRLQARVVGAGGTDDIGAAVMPWRVEGEPTVGVEGFPVLIGGEAEGEGERVAKLVDLVSEIHPRSGLRQ